MKISKEVDDWTEQSWQNAITSEVIFVIESLLQWLHLSSAMVSSSTFFCKFSKIGSMISSYASFAFSKFFEFFNFFRNVEKFWKNKKECMMISRNLFLKIQKSWWDTHETFFWKIQKKLMTDLPTYRPTNLPTDQPTDIHDLRIYATSRRIKIWV